MRLLQLATKYLLKWLTYIKPAQKPADQSIRAQKARIFHKIKKGQLTLPFFGAKTNLIIKLAAVIQTKLNWMWCLT